MVFQPQIWSWNRIDGLENAVSHLHILKYKQYSPHLHDAHIFVYPSVNFHFLLLLYRLFQIFQLFLLLLLLCVFLPLEGKKWSSRGNVVSYASIHIKIKLHLKFSNSLILSSTRIKHICNLSASRINIMKKKLEYKTSKLPTKNCTGIAALL